MELLSITNGLTHLLSTSVCIEHLQHLPGHCAPGAPAERDPGRIVCEVLPGVQWQACSEGEVMDQEELRARETIAELMSEVRERLKLLESALERRVDAMVAPDSKLPFQVLCCRAGFAWRMAELSRSAFESLEMGRLVSAILLTRASVETCAGLWYLSAKIEAAVDQKTVGDIGEQLGRLLLGSKRDPNMPDPINVLTFVDRVEKDFEGFREQYDMLSEYAHPNWSSTQFLYSKLDPRNLWTDFAANTRGRDSAERIGVANLTRFANKCYALRAHQ